MVVDSRHREKTFKIEKKLSKSRKKFWNPQNTSESKKINYEIEKKKLKSRKIFRNREKYFRIEKTISESRNILLEELRKNLWN